MPEQFRSVDLEAAGARSPEKKTIRTFGTNDHSRSSSSFSGASSSAASSVFQVPKTAILKEAPMGRTNRSNKKHYRLRRRCSFCRILSWLIVTIFVLVVVLAVLYLVYTPTVPSYTVDSLSIRPLNVSDSVYPSPEINVTIRAENRNKKVGIFYESGSYVTVSYSGEQLASGGMPVFYQGPKNVAFLSLFLTGSNVRLSISHHESLIREEKEGKVPLSLSLKVPLRLKFGAVKTWKFAVKVHCDTVVDKLTANSEILSNSCKYTFDI